MSGFVFTPCAATEFFGRHIDARILDEAFVASHDQDRGFTGV